MKYQFRVNRVSVTLLVLMVLYIVMQSALGAGVVSAATPASAPTKFSPSNGATGVSLAPAFSWGAVSGATHYGLYIRDMVTGNLVFDSDGQISLTGTSFALPSGMLVEGRTYRWNMRAGNAAGWGPFSTHWSFTTGTTIVPPAPAPVAPASDPIANRSSPSQQSVTLTQGQSQNFTAHVTDRDGDLLRVEWYLNGTHQHSALVSGSSASSSWAHSFASQGNFTVQAIVFDRRNDGTRVGSCTWVVTVAAPAAPARPDLTVSSVSAPASAETGRSISVTFTVRNQGTAPAGTFTNRVFLATTPHGEQIPLGNFQMASLTAGASSQQTVEVTINMIPK